MRGLSHISRRNIAIPVLSRSYRLVIGRVCVALIFLLAGTAYSAPDHIRFASVPLITDTNSGFTVLITALNADGSVQSNFNGTLTLTAIGTEDALPLASTNSGNFTAGQRYATILVTVPGHGIRIGCLECAGQSDAFTVIPPPFYSSSQSVADIVWMPGSQTLLASVPANGGVYSNRLVAIDSTTGLATNSYPVGYNPGQIEISPDGNYVYLSLDGGISLQRFNLNTRLAGAPFALGTNGTSTRFAYDFCVPPSTTDAVVVASRLRDGLGNTSVEGIFRWDSGSEVTLPNFSSAGGWLVESMDSSNQVLLSPPLAKGDASTGAVLASNPNFPGKSVIYRSGEIFDDQGNAYSSGALALLGTYPGMLDQFYYAALPEVDPVFRRLFFLTGYFNFGSAFYKLKVYDRDLFQPLFQLTMPSAAGSPTRLLRCGTNFLAYVTGDNHLWFIRPDATQPPRAPADLSLWVSAPASAPIVASNYTFSLTLFNAGPGLASLVQVTNALPANTLVGQTVLSTGTLTLNGSAFVWNVSNLGVGSNATLQVTVQFNTAGWQTNTAWALGYEADSVFTNNIAVLPLYPQLSQTGFGAVAVNYGSQDLLYDPVRDRLLLTVTNGPGGTPTNGLAIFNPYTGLTESFVPLSPAPGKMARSDNGQFLYVSLPGTGAVQQFNLPTLTPNYSFLIGGELIYDLPYTNYAGSLAVLPGQPDSVVAWAVRHVNGGSGEFGYGVGLYEHGVMAPNVTQMGGSWQVLFDTDLNTLLAYNAGDLRRCGLDANGVTFVQQYPTLFGAGNDIQYAAGHLFNNGGEMVDYAPFQVDWLFSGAQNATLVALDGVTGRVFFLVQNGGWQLKAYDIATRRLLGAQTISNVIGTPSKLIRWGADGLAFQTSGNQLFIVRSPLVVTNAFADLVLNLTGPVGSISVSNTATFTATVVNQGTIQATNLFVTNTLSAGGTLLTASASVGTLATNSQTVVWSLPSLDPGAFATLTFAGTAVQPGLLTVISAATTATFEPLTSNNTAVAIVLIGAPINDDTPSIFLLPANDVVWSPDLGKLLLTASAGIPNWAGGLLSVDPNSFAVQFQAALGTSAGRLALSADNSVLYAGTDSGATEISLPAVSVASRFLINPTSPGAFAYDLKVAPGANKMLVIGSKTTANNSTWVAAFTNGTQLPTVDSFFSTILSLQFGNAPSPLYVYNGSGFNRYTIDTNGATLLDSSTTLLPAATAMDLVWGNGLIYSSTGPVINPVNLTVRGTIPGIPTGSRVLYDSLSGLVFFLSPGANQATLSAFDGPTLLPVGSRNIPGVNGALTRFIRWGVDGFAALTSNNQLAVLRSSLIPTNPPADVSVSLQQSAAPYFQGSNITSLLVISNAGPNVATSISWSNALPTGAAVVNANASAGTLTTNGNSLAGAISTLAPGAVVNVSVTFVVPATGVLSDQLIATASSIDPNFANNSQAALLWIQPTNGPSSLMSLTFTVKDLERDPVRPVIYASLGSTAGALANSVVTIDPINGIISSPISVGSDPGRLAVSPDGQFLYVALDGGGAVQKLSLPSLASVGSFAVPQNQTVIRMAVCPTNSDMVAVRRSPDGKTSLYVAGVKLANELSTQDLFAFLDTTGQLFGCDGAHSNVKLYQLNTGAAGLSLSAAQPGKQSNSTDLQSSGGLLFFNGGMVINPTTTRGIDLMPVASTSVVAPDAGCGRAFYLTGSGSVWALRAFDIGQGIEVGSVSLPVMSGAPQKLLRWGTNGLATYNTKSQVIIFRGLLVPTNPPVDIALTQSITPTAATVSDTITFALRVTNVGPATASGVAVTQNFSIPLTNVILTPSSGTAGYTNGVVSWQLGIFSANDTATLSVSGRPVQTGTLGVSSFANHDLNDVFWGNNAAIGTVNVFAPGTSSTLLVPLAARQLVYDSLRDVIYASTPASNRLSGNLIAVIDPATGAMKGALAAGSEPDRISLSTDSGYLHVALNGAMGVQRFNLLANSADISFGFSTNDIYYAQDLLVQPGNASTVAASLSSYNMAAGFPSTVLAYDGGVARPNSGGPARGLAFSSDGSTLFGCVSPGISSAFERMVLNASGFTTTSVPGFTAVPNSLLFNSGRLYSSAGQVADASTGTLLGSMSVSGPEAVDGAAGRAFFLVQSGTNWQIRAFDLSTFQLAGTQTVFGVRGTPLNLIRCGQDRLAFSTSAGQTIIAHSILTMTNVMTSPSPTFHLLSSPGMFTNPPSLQIDTQPGSWYTVYTSSNLANWNVLTNFYASLPNIQIADPATNRFSARFYRVSSP